VNAPKHFFINFISNENTLAMKNENARNGKKEKKQVTKASVKQELENDERFANYFKDFNAASVKRFIDEYAENKEAWWGDKELYIKRNENESLQWINEAQQHLEKIQQKKLFDAQCLWRAEKRTFAEVQICFDFQVWERNVLHCPFLEPVSDDDIDLYIQFLNEGALDRDPDDTEDWQNYDFIKGSYEDGVYDELDFPGWYKFYNEQRETESLLLLPDIRGEKEDIYITLHHNKENEKNKQKNKQPENDLDNRPMLRYNDIRTRDLFIKTFEDRETQYYYKEHRHWKFDKYENDEIEEMISVLLSERETVPIEGHDDFKEGIRCAYYRYRNGKIAEFLPFAYEEYKLNRSMGLGASEDNRKAMENYKGLRKRYYDSIIQGRILNGEPGDLNF
jgi:hypothetical protein